MFLAIYHGKNLVNHPVFGTQTLISQIQLANDQLIVGVLGDGRLCSNLTRCSYDLQLYKLLGSRFSPRQHIVGYSKHLRRRVHIGLRGCALLRILYTTVYLDRRRRMRIGVLLSPWN